MTQYECEACKGSSEMPGVCQTEGCTMNGQPLKEKTPADGSGQAPGAPEAPSTDMPGQEEPPQGM